MQVRTKKGPFCAEKKIALCKPCAAIVSEVAKVPVLKKESQVVFYFSV